MTGSDAWTNPNSDIGWWGPKNFTKLLQQIDLRVGGWHRLGIVSPEGEKHVSGGVYGEIGPPQRLVMTEAREDTDGKPGHETQVSITFDERDDETEMVFMQTGFADTASRDGHREGWNEAFDALTGGLARAAATKAAE